MKKVKLQNTTPTNTQEPTGNFDSGAGMAGMMGSLFGGLANAATNQTEENHDENIVDIPEETVTEQHNDTPEESDTAVAATEEASIKDYVRQIKTATPFVITSTVIEEKSNVASMVFLCTDLDDNVFTVSRSYVIDSEDEDLLIKSNAYHEDSLPMNDKIAAHFIMNNLPCYVTDFDFTVNNGFEKAEAPLLTITAIDSHDDMRTSVKLAIDADIYASLAFMDSYIFDDINNPHDFDLSYINSSKPIQRYVNFFLVDSVDIVSMCPAVATEKSFFDKIKEFFKKSEDEQTTLAIVTKLTKFISNTEKETASLLMPLDTGVKFEKNKFRDLTSEKLIEKYYGDADQFVSNYIISEARLLGVDKEYFAVRAKNKDEVVRIFLFDATIMEDLKHKIEIF